MSRGGTRIGAGRHKKPLEQRIMDGDVSKDDVSLPAPNIPNDDLLDISMPEIKEWLTKQQRDGKPFGADVELKRIYNWVVDMGCERQVPMMLLEQFAADRARWILLQDKISSFGEISKKGESNVMVSPYYNLLLLQEKNMNNVYMLIDQIVRNNCISGYHQYDPNQRKMAQLLDGD